MNTTNNKLQREGRESAYHRIVRSMFAVLVMYALFATSAHADGDKYSGGNRTFNYTINYTLESRTNRTLEEGETPKNDTRQDSVDEQRDTEEHRQEDEAALEVWDLNGDIDCKNKTLSNATNTTLPPMGPQMNATQNGTLNATGGAVNDTNNITVNGTINASPLNVAPDVVDNASNASNTNGQPPIIARTQERNEDDGVTGVRRPPRDTAFKSANQAAPSNQKAHNDPIPEADQTEERGIFAKLLAWLGIL